MRCRLAQIVVFVAACFVAGKPHVIAQSCDSDDEQPSGPEISIADVTFSGTLQLAASDQAQIAASINERARGDSLDEVTDEALERVRAGWQNQGYFKVQVRGDARTLTSNSVSQRIALGVHVDEGQQYNLGHITFKHNKVIRNSEALRDLFPIKDGDIFSRVEIATGLENLRKAYGQIGYINFTFVPDTKFDDQERLVNLDIDMDEGKQFYVSGISVLGLDEPARQELLKDLPIRRGQIYNSRLWELSLLKHASMFPCNCHHYEPLRLDEQRGTVAVTLDFRPCSTD
jgi:outer membrane protein insertion porin family